MDMNFVLSSSESDSSDSTSSEDDLEELLQDEHLPKNQNYILETVQAFTDIQFMEHFRVGRAVANEISVRFEQSDMFHYQSGGNEKISALHQVYIFLWYAGHEAASFRDVGDRFNISISSLFRIIRRLIYFLSNLSPEVIRWPQQQEQQEIEQFYRDKRFPGIIGALDGSHIRIDRPERDPDSYYNRKKYFSIQVQAVCDHQRRIRSLFAGFPGSVHDARVFRRSPLSDELADKCGNNFIIADSAYGCTRHLITSFKDNGHLSRRQKNFNKRHSQCRVVIEHCFGTLKQKFRQLYHCKLRSIRDIVHFIRACCVLHNLSIDDELQLPEELENVNEDNPVMDNVDDDNDDLERDAPDGLAYRNYLVETMDL